MGQNNRQRRRHKQQKQQRRGRPSPQRGHHRQHSPGDPGFLAEGFAILTESIAAGRPLEHDAILSALAREWDAGAASAASDALRSAIAAAWEHGWQPADLVHAFGRKLSQVDRRLLVSVVLADEQQWRAHPHADPDWLAQVDELGADRRATGAGAGDTAGGVVAGWATAQRLDRVEALLRSATLLGTLWQMPTLPPVGEPPSAWWRSTRPRTSPAAGGTDDRMLARVRALLAKAESTEFAPEAEALTAKA